MICDEIIRIRECFFRGSDSFSAHRQLSSEETSVGSLESCGISRLRRPAPTVRAGQPDGGLPSNRGVLLQGRVQKSCWPRMLSNTTTRESEYEWLLLISIVDMQLRLLIELAFDDGHHSPSRAVKAFDVSPSISHSLHGGARRWRFTLARPVCTDYGDGSGLARPKADVERLRGPVSSAEPIGDSTTLVISLTLTRSRAFSGVRPVSPARCFRAY